MNKVIGAIGIISMIGIGSILVSMAHAYPSEWDELGSFENEKEIYEFLGQACCIGGGLSLKEGKEFESWALWTNERGLFTYHLETMNYDREPENYYEIEYFINLPFVPGFKIKSGVFSVQNYEDNKSAHEIACCGGATH